MAVSRRGLQAVLLLLGLVAVVAGSATVLTGGSLVVERGEVSASVDSELRFHGAWYVAAGLVLLRAVSRVERETILIRTICAVVFVAACGRLISLVVVGAPHPLYLTLMVIEFAIPVVVVPWQAAVARQAA